MLEEGQLITIYINEIHFGVIYWKEGDFLFLQII